VGTDDAYHALVRDALERSDSMGPEYTALMISDPSYRYILLQLNNIATCFEPFVFDLDYKADPDDLFSGFFDRLVFFVQSHSNLTRKSKPAHDDQLDQRYNNMELDDWVLYRLLEKARGRCNREPEDLGDVVLLKNIRRAMKWRESIRVVNKADFDELTKRLDADKVHDLRSELAKTKNQLTQLLLTNANLDELNDALEAKCKKSDTAYDKAMRLLGESKEAARLSDVKVEELQEDVTKLEATVKKLRDQVPVCSGNDRENEQIAALRAENDQLRTDYNNAVITCRAIKQSNHDLQAEMARLGSARVVMQTELEQANKSLDDSKRQIVVLSNAYTAIGEAYDRLQGEKMNVDDNQTTRELQAERKETIQTLQQAVSANGLELFRPQVLANGIEYASFPSLVGKVPETVYPMLEYVVNLLNLWREEASAQRLHVAQMKYALQHPLDISESLREHFTSSNDTAEALIMNVAAASKDATVSAMYELASVLQDRVFELRVNALDSDGATNASLDGIRREDDIKTLLDEKKALLEKLDRAEKKAASSSTPASSVRIGVEAANLLTAINLIGGTTSPLPGNIDDQWVVLMDVIGRLRSDLRSGILLLNPSGTAIRNPDNAASDARTLFERVRGVNACARDLLGVVIKASPEKNDANVNAMDAAMCLTEAVTIVKKGARSLAELQHQLDKFQQGIKACLEAADANVSIDSSKPLANLKSLHKAIKKLVGSNASSSSSSPPPSSSSSASSAASSSSSASTDFEQQLRRLLHASDDQYECKPLPEFDADSYCSLIWENITARKRCIAATKSELEQTIIVLDPDVASSSLTLVSALDLAIQAGALVAKRSAEWQRQQSVATGFVQHIRQSTAAVPTSSYSAASEVETQFAELLRVMAAVPPLVYEADAWYRLVRDNILRITTARDEYKQDYEHLLRSIEEELELQPVASATPTTQIHRVTVSVEKLQTELRSTKMDLTTAQARLVVLRSTSSAPSPIVAPVVDLTAEVRRLEAEVDYFRLKYEKLKADVKSLAEGCNVEVKAADTTEDTFASLTDAFTGLQDELQAANARIQILESKTQSSASTSSSSSSVASTAAQTIQQLTIEIQRLTSEQKSLQTRFDALTAETTTKDARIGQLVATVADRDRQIQNMQIDVTRLTAEVTTVNTQVRALTSTRDLLQTEVATLTTDRNLLLTQVDTLGGERDTLRTTNAALVTSNATTIADLDDERLQNTNLRTDIDVRTTERDNLRRDLNALTATNQATNARVTSLATENARVVTDHNALQTTLAALNQTHGLTVAELDAMTLERDNLLATNATLSAQLALFPNGAPASSSAANQSVPPPSASIASIAEIHRLETELAALRLQNNSLSRKLASARSQSRVGAISSGSGGPSRGSTVSSQSTQQQRDSSRYLIELTAMEPQWSSKLPPSLDDAVIKSACAFVQKLKQLFPSSPQAALGAYLLINAAKQIDPNTNAAGGYILHREKTFQSVPVLLYSTAIALLSGQGIVLIGANESDEELDVKTNSNADEKGQFFNAFHANFALTARLLQELNGQRLR
jgi:hypothetical protein